MRYLWGLVLKLIYPARTIEPAPIDGMEAIRLANEAVEKGRESFKVPDHMLGRKQPASQEEMTDGIEHMARMVESGAIKVGNVRSVRPGAMIPAQPMRAPELMPSPQECELQQLRAEVAKLRRERDNALQTSRDTDIRTIKGVENAKGQEMKFRLLKNNYRTFKILAADLIEYMELKALPSNPQIAGIIDACKELGAVDPELFGLSKKQKLQLIENSQLAAKVLRHDAGLALPPENTELGHPVAAYLEAQSGRPE